MTTATLGRRLSPMLVTIAVVLFCVGLLLGIYTFTARSPEPEPHVAGTNAWPVHLVLAVLTVLWLVFAYRRRARGNDPQRLLLLAPVGARAASRIGITTDRARRQPATALRLVLAVGFAAMIAYGAVRAGLQITGGLDSDFTVNAWGGPSYLGALLCHYLDGALIVAVCANIVDALLLPAEDPTREG